MYTIWKKILIKIITTSLSLTYLNNLFILFAERFVSSMGSRNERKTRLINCDFVARDAGAVLPS